MWGDMFFSVIRAWALGEVGDPEIREITVFERLDALQRAREEAAAEALKKSKKPKNIWAVPSRVKAPPQRSRGGLGNRIALMKQRKVHGIDPAVKKEHRERMSKLEGLRKTLVAQTNRQAEAVKHAQVLIEEVQDMTGCADPRSSSGRGNNYILVQHGQPIAGNPQPASSASGQGQQATAAAAVANFRKRSRETDDQIHKERKMIEAVLRELLTVDYYAKALEVVEEMLRDAPGLGLYHTTVSRHKRHGGGAHRPAKEVEMVETYTRYQEDANATIEKIASMAHRPHPVPEELKEREGLLLIAARRHLRMHGCNADQVKWFKQRSLANCERLQLTATH